jgi:hypothetical protein
MDKDAMLAAQRANPHRIYFLDPAFLHAWKAKRAQEQLAATWEAIRTAPRTGRSGSGPRNWFMRKRARRNAEAERKRRLAQRAERR